MYTTRGDTGTHTNKHIHASKSRRRVAASRDSPDNTHTASAACSKYTESEIDHCLRGVYERPCVSNATSARRRDMHMAWTRRSNGRHTP